MAYRRPKRLRDLLVRDKLKPERPVEGIIIPKSGHATAYVERFVHVILPKLGPFAYVWVKNTQFGVQGLCALYTLSIWAQWCW